MIEGRGELGIGGKEEDSRMEDAPLRRRVGWSWKSVEAGEGQLN